MRHTDRVCLTFWDVSRSFGLTERDAVATLGKGTRPNPRTEVIMFTESLTAIARTIADSLPEGWQCVVSRGDGFSEVFIRGAGDEQEVAEAAALDAITALLPPGFEVWSAWSLAPTAGVVRFFIGPVA